MGSRKPSAKAKQVAAFKAELGGMARHLCREERRREQRAAEHEEALREKACRSKSLFCRSEAEEAIRACADHGTTGLHSYRCPFCNGWHLTSKPERK